MRIQSVTTWKEHFLLTKPYTIAYETFDHVENIFVRLNAGDGSFGIGVASPAPDVTAESATDCQNALNQYLMNEKRRETAQKNIPKHRIVSLDAIEPPFLPQAVIESNPEDSYNYAWVSALLDQVLSDVERTCREQGMETHWNVFSEKVVEPMLNNAKPPSLIDICEKYFMLVKHTEKLMEQLYHKLKLY